MRQVKGRGQFVVISPRRWGWHWLCVLLAAAAAAAACVLASRSAFDIEDVDMGGRQMAWEGVGDGDCCAV